MTDYLDLIREDLEAAAQRLGDEPQRARRRRAAGGLTALAAAVALVVTVLATTGSAPTETAAPPRRAAPRPAGGDKIGELVLRAPDGSGASGTLELFASGGTDFTFRLRGRDLPPNRGSEAYATYLTGPGVRHFIGFAPRVGPNGVLGTSGPRSEDTGHFAAWLKTAKRFVVATTPGLGATTPGAVVLTADLQRMQGPQQTAGPAPWVRIAAALGPDIPVRPASAKLRETLNLSQRSTPAGEDLELDLDHVFEIPVPDGAGADTFPGANTGWFVVPGAQGVCTVNGPSSSCGGSAQKFIDKGSAPYAVHDRYLAYSGIVRDGFVTVRALDRSGAQLADSPIKSNAFYLEVPGSYRGKDADPNPKLILVRSDGTTERMR